MEQGDALFKRYEGNPIITPSKWPYLVNATFNPGAIKHDGKTLLLVRAEDMRGFSHLTIARSKDGKTNWQIDEEPFLKPEPSIKEERWGLEDPRIVYLEDRQQYAITYVSFSKGGPTVSLALSKDFKTVERQGIMLPPEDKDASLLPRKVNGRYVLIHRPIIRNEAHIWISFSPDLKYWGDHQILIPVRPGWWDCSKVGLGPPPIETEDGWLVIYHGIRVTASGSLYRVGLALLDLDEPWRVIKRSDYWILGPRERYERIGDVPGVTFPTGVTIDKKNGEVTVNVYYGAADSNICLATAKLDKLIDFILNDKSPHKDGLG